MTEPARGAASVTPNDSNDLAVKPARALYIGTSGNVVLTTVDGDSVTFANVPVGILPVSCNRVQLTGTTAGNIVALY